MQTRVHVRIDARVPISFGHRLLLQFESTAFSWPEYMEAGCPGRRAGSFTETGLG